MKEYKKDDLVEVNILDMGMDGEGIGKVEGFTFFIKDAVPGDVVQAKIMKVKKGYAYARLMTLVSPSKDRVEPKCAFHKQCGGCQIQALSYEKQLELKQKKVFDHLTRIGGFDSEFITSIMEPVVGMQNPWRYRNKAQFPIGKDKNGNTITGFYAGHTHSIISNTDCMLGVDENKEILEAVLSYMKDCKVTPYDEETNKGLVRHVLTRKGFTSGELMVCLIINGRKLPASEVLIDKLTKIDGMKSISVNVNTEKTNVIMGNETICIWGEPTISDTIHPRSMEEINSGIFDKNDTGVTFNISPQSFYQVNPVQTEKLYSLALEYAELTGNETVWDLYCGIGTISLFMAKKAKKVYGVEIIPQAIEDAKKNAKLNGITNAEFFVGKAEEVLPEFYDTNVTNGNDEMLHPDVICVDPPRKGCDQACLDTMVKMAPSRIVYVSCDSATMARDVKFLCENGYKLKRVRPVDQFGHTVHVETVVLLSKV